MGFRDLTGERKMFRNRFMVMAAPLSKFPKKKKNPTGVREIFMCEICLNNAVCLLIYLLFIFIIFLCLQQLGGLPSKY